MINWLLNKRIEIVVNPHGYERAIFRGQRRVSLAPRLYFLWGYDIGEDMNVLAFRLGAQGSPHGIKGWALDFTLQRRGPVWAWRRVRKDWAGDAARGAKIAARIEELIAESARRAA